MAFERGSKPEEYRAGRDGDGEFIPDRGSIVIESSTYVFTLVDCGTRSRCCYPHRGVAVRHPESSWR